MNVKLFDFGAEALADSSSAPPNKKNV